MQLEIGDLFVVRRGAITRPLLSRPEDEPVYDTRFEGLVFRVAAISGPFIAAKIEAGGMPIGTVISIDIEKVEIWPVDLAYLDAFKPAYGANLMQQIASTFGIPHSIATGPFTDKTHGAK